MALFCAIRSAQDATPPEGQVDATPQANGCDCTARIIDTGCGMDETFIRERLFRPFDSTKGTHGMGIGAYQVRETVRSAGGEIRVKSTLEKGTEVVLSFGLDN